MSRNVTLTRGMQYLLPAINVQKKRFNVGNILRD